jgi:hypothetical protein
MKKCPVCDKTFEDSMRFCQTDGTALFEVVEETPEDPFKTMVARPSDDFASAIPTPSDPFKTMVAGAPPPPPGESGDLLQLPEEYDAMKTSVVSQSERDELGLNEPQEVKSSDYSPSAPYSEESTPFDSKSNESPNVFSSAAPEPPQFSEPNINPPNFGDMNSSTDPSESATEIFSSGSIPSSSSYSAEPSAPKDSWGDSPFSKPSESIPSPFDTPQQQTPSYKEPEPPTILGGMSPFDQPPMFGQQDQFNQPASNQSLSNQPVSNQQSQQNDWSPPPAPGSNWQDQGLGANTPFQPPVAGGQENTLAIVSLVLGVGSFICLGIVMGIPAVITGYMQKNNIKKDPARYGGGGMATAGMILGAVNIVLTVIFVIIYAIIIVSNLR